MGPASQGVHIHLQRTLERGELAALQPGQQVDSVGERRLVRQDLGPQSRKDAHRSQGTHGTGEHARVSSQRVPLGHGLFRQVCQQYFNRPFFSFKISISLLKTIYQWIILIDIQL